MRTLVLGFGNPGRLDDGLGPAVVEALRAYELPGVTLDADYQLRVEDAAEIAGYDAVVFVDASLVAQAPFEVERVLPEPDRRFSTHSVAPGALLGVAETCFGARVPGWIVGVRGEVFDDYGEGLSPEAERNRDAAIKFLASVLGKHRFDGALADALEAQTQPLKGAHHA